MITAAQIRAARAMLGWSVRALARKADVPEFAVEWIEGAGMISAKDRKAMKAIQSSLEEAGIEFVGYWVRAAPSCPATHKSSFPRRRLLT